MQIGTCKLCLEQDAQHCAVNCSRRTSARGPTGSKSVGAAVDLLKPECSEHTSTLRVRHMKQSFIAVCSDSHAENVPTLCGQNADRQSNVQAGGTYSYRCALHVRDYCYEKRQWLFCFWRFSPSSA